MPRDPSPEREIFRITDDELSLDDFEDDWVPLNQKPSRMARICKKISYMFKRTPRATYTDGL
jgi:hypothetical protein